MRPRKVTLWCNASLTGDTEIFLAKLLEEHDPVEQWRHCGPSSKHLASSKYASSLQHSNSPCTVFVQGHHSFFTLQVGPTGVWKWPRLQVFKNMALIGRWLCQIYERSNTNRLTLTICHARYHGNAMAIYHLTQRHGTAKAECHDDHVIILIPR